MRSPNSPYSYLAILEFASLQRHEQHIKPRSLPENAPSTSPRFVSDDGDTPVHERFLRILQALQRHVQEPTCKVGTTETTQPSPLLGQEFAGSSVQGASRADFALHSLLKRKLLHAETELCNRFQYLTHTIMPNVLLAALAERHVSGGPVSEAELLLDSPNRLSFPGAIRSDAWPAILEFAEHLGFARSTQTSRFGASHSVSLNLDTTASWTT